jgi:hypothetical protein
MIGLRTAEIAAAEGGTWQPRRAWAAIDAAVGAGGALLRVHDSLYAGQHASPVSHHSMTGHHSGKGTAP